MPSKQDSPKVLEEGRAFIAKAEEAYAAGDYGMAAFYSEQSIELILNSVMLRVNGNYMNGHNIIFNCRQLMHFYKPITPLLGDCTLVANYYFDADAGQKPPKASADDAKRAIASAKKCDSLA